MQEIVHKNKIKYLVVGIGLNLVKSPNIKNYPTTNLYEITKNKINANNVSNQLVLVYEKFLKSQKVFK